MVDSILTPLCALPTPSRYDDGWVIQNSSKATRTNSYAFTESASLDEGQTSWVVCGDPQSAIRGRSVRGRGRGRGRRQQQPDPQGQVQCGGGTPGSCIDSAQLQCVGGGLLTGLCPGAAHVQCCPSATTVPATFGACGEGELGTCIDTTVAVCRGAGTTSGLCPGGTSDPQPGQC